MNGWDRRSGIGASEVPAIVGLSPWRTPVAVWLSKVGLGGEQASTPAMRTGNALERTIMAMAAADTDTRFRHNTQTFPHPSWPTVPLFATPDGFGPRRSGLVEVKVVGWRGADWSGGPPAYVLAQVQAQLACLPRTKVATVAALLGSEVKTWPVERDPEAAEAIVDGVAEWWARHVIGGMSPEPVTDEDVWAVLRARVNHVERAARPPSIEEEAIGADLVSLLRDADAINALVAERRMALAQAAADGDVVDAATGWRASWTTRTTTDWKAVAKSRGATDSDALRFATAVPVFTFRRPKATDASQEQADAGVFV